MTTLSETVIEIIGEEMSPESREIQYGSGKTRFPVHTLAKHTHSGKQIIIGGPSGGVGSTFKAHYKFNDFGNFTVEQEGPLEILPKGLPTYTYVTKPEKKVTVKGLS